MFGVRDLSPFMPVVVTGIVNHEQFTVFSLNANGVRAISGTREFTQQREFSVAGIVQHAKTSFHREWVQHSKEWKGLQGKQGWNVIRDG